jgi:hypothetical protein
LNTTETPPSNAGNRSILAIASGYVFEYTFIATSDHRRSEVTDPTQNQLAIMLLADVLC